MRTLYYKLVLSVTFLAAVTASSIHTLNTVKEDSEEDDLVVEDEDSEVGLSVFEPTSEWKVVEKGQAIPAGLHVRMNLQTGVREAKLMEDVPGYNESEDELIEPGSDNKEREDDTVGNTDEPKEEERSMFTGDQRRVHHHGESDRRGIVNKRTKVFTRQEYVDMSREQVDVDPSHHPALTAQPSLGDQSITASSHVLLDKTQEEDHVVLPVTVHGDIAAMLTHTQTLAHRGSTIPDLLQALDELEYHVHEIDNARDLNAVGGLVVIVRLLNHSSPDVRGSAATVIGSASQSNPAVQKDIHSFGGLQLLCTLISPTQPDLVQRRALFALGALLRGNPTHQEQFVDSCRGVHILGGTFAERSARVKAKAVTLVMDIINEQSSANPHSKVIVEQGWCVHVSSLIHSDEPLLLERGLQGMVVLQDMCDFTTDMARLKQLAHELDNDRESVTLLEHCKLLLKTLRQQNMEL